MDGWGAVCANLYDYADVLYGDLYYSVFIYVLSLDAELQGRTVIKW